MGRERGQTLVMMALMLVGLVAFLALVVDLGNVFAQRRFIQNAADAGALAGARELALSRDWATIELAVNEYAILRNGAQWCVATQVSQTVVVTAGKTFPTYFAAIVGVPTFTVQASAVGGYSFPRSWGGGLMPMAVHRSLITETREIQIWDDANTASDPGNALYANGHRGWLNFNGGAVGDTEIVDWVTNGYPGRVEVDSWVNGTPGTKTAALHAMDLVRTHTVIFVPVYDGTRAGQMGSGSLDYHIVAFAAFYVTKVVDTGNPKYVQGQFRRWVTAQETGGWIDSGVRIVGLK